MARHKKRKTKKSHKSGHVPLPILERRLHKLSALVASRGGHAKAHTTRRKKTHKRK